MLLLGWGQELVTTGGGLAGLLSVEAFLGVGFVREVTCSAWGCWVQGWCLWARSWVPAWQLSGLSGSHALGTHSHIRKQSLSGTSVGPEWAETACPVCTGALRPLTPSPSAGLSIFLVSFCVCIPSSAPSLPLAPPLLCLPAWDSAGRMRYCACRQEPTARGLPPAAGVARCCLALWSSEQVDRHLLPVWPLGVACYDSSTHRETPPRTCMSPRAVGWRPAGHGEQTWPSHTPLKSVKKSCARGQPPSHTHTGAQGRWVCVPVHVSPVSVPFCCVSCASGPSPGPPSSTIPTLGGGLPGARGFVHCLGEQVEILLSAHVLPRPAPIPMPWVQCPFGATCTAGRMGKPSVHVTRCVQASMTLCVAVMASRWQCVRTGSFSL